MSNDEMSNVQSGNGKCRTTDRNNLDPKKVKLALRKVREEADEKRRLDPKRNPIPRSAFKDVERFMKALNRAYIGAFGQVVHFPQMMALNNADIGLEWRDGQKMFTMSIGGDGHIVFAGVFGPQSKIRGVFTFTRPKMLAIACMIESVFS